MRNQKEKEEINDYDKLELIGEDSGKKTITKSKKSSKIMREILFYVCLIVLCCRIIPNYVVAKTYVDGVSMEPTLHDKNYLLTNNFSLLFDDPDRYDIVIIMPYGKKVNQRFVKRVIGLPGETIQVTNDTIYINGKAIKDPYKNESMLNGGIAEKPITLGEDEYFVMGDNRNASQDSRDETIGPISRKNFVGRPFLRVWPLDEFGIVK